MSWKITLVYGLISSVIASLAAVVYAKVYTEALAVNYDGVLATANMIAASSFGTMMMAAGSKVVYTWKGYKALGWLNIVYGILSFISIIGVFGFSLPLDIKAPELFPGLVIPMHFFPLLSHLMIGMFFIHKTVNDK